MATSIAVSDETRKALMRLKLEEGARSVDELLGRMLVAYRKQRFAEASSLFRERVDRTGVRVDDLGG